MSAKEFLPKKFSEDDDQEDEGNLIIKNLLAENKQVKVRLEGNDKTPGRDGFIELRDAERVTGKLEVQAKPVDSEYKKKGQLAYTLPRTLIGYAERAGLPVILICYDRDTKKAYWKHLTRELFDGAKPDQGTRVINFVADDEIGDGKSYCDDWSLLVAKHLEALRLADQMRSAIELLQADKGFTGMLDSPEALAVLLKRVHDTAGEKYKVKLEDAQKLFNDSEITGAVKILAPLAEELLTDKQSASVLFDVLIGDNLNVRLATPGSTTPKISAGFFSSAVK